MQKSINSAVFRKMVLAGAKLLENNRAKVDALNVFPVPDGDTGTNMSLTMQSAVKELSAAATDFSSVCDLISKGALRGARGNSGVILSQIFRGICSVLANCKSEADTRTFAKALEAGTKVAYNAVSIPKEGTILTVVRMMSEFAVKSAGKFKDFESFLPAIIAEGDRALAMTPELLPVLKKAGVVDSGGVGLMTIMRGFLAAITNDDIVTEIQTEAANANGQGEDEFGDNSDIIGMELGEIQYAYCTEFFVINLKKSTTLADIDRLRENLMGIGDSVICIGDLELIKVHVHTNCPGVALTYALELGELDRPKIENMLEQNRALKAKIEAEKKDQGMLAICAGEGIAEIFKDLFVDRVIEGGQTMNPSASDIATAVQKINAENVFVFPNNKNIILATEQAKALVENRTIHVIPTKNIPQGFAAALSFNPEASAEENKTNMIHALDNVRAGQVTRAVRTTNVNGFNIKEGDIIGLDDKKILAKSENIEDTVLKLLDKLKDDSHEMITLYYGSEVKEEDAQTLTEKVREAFPDCEADCLSGGQPVYYYLLSLE